MAGIAAFGAAIMLLWNWLMPVIFGLGTLCYWQALGLLLLARLLFGHMGHGHSGGWHGHKSRMREKWMKMTPEERERFVNEHHAGHFFGSRAGECCGNHDEKPAAE